MQEKSLKMWAGGERKEETERKEGRRREVGKVPREESRKTFRVYSSIYCLCALLKIISMLLLPLSQVVKTNVRTSVIAGSL